MSEFYVIKIQDPTDRSKFITKYKTLKDYDWVEQMKSPKGMDVLPCKTVKRYGSKTDDGSST